MQIAVIERNAWRWMAFIFLQRIAIALPASSSIARRDVKTCSTSKIRMLTVTFHLALAEPIMGLRENGVGVM
jgi:hypothetical protein